MLPDEAAAMLAKVIFVVSAAMVLCMARVRAEEVSPIANPTKVVQYKVVKTL